MHFVPGFVCRSRTNPMNAGLRMVTSLVQRQSTGSIHSYYGETGNLETHFNFQVADNVRLNSFFFLTSTLLA